MIAQPLSSPADDARSTRRTTLFLSAMLGFGSVSTPIRIRDLSAGGARVEGAFLPDVGTGAIITRGALTAGGTVMWRDPSGCGLRFDHPLSIDAWMPSRSGCDQSVVDQQVELVKSGAAVLPILSPAPPSQALRDALPQRLAEELAYVSRLLESLGDDLCNETLVVMRHGEKLQNLDISAQILGHVAALLVAEQPEQAVRAIGMGCLRKRLLRTAL